MKPHYTGATYELTQENMNHLIAQLEAAQRKLEITKETLKFYAQSEGWDMGCGCCAGEVFVIQDQGEQARQALEAIK